MRIVVVEDQTMMRNLVVKICREQGHTIVGETSSGKAAIELCHQFLPEILLLDLGLPDIKGMEVAEMLLSAFPALAILVFSSYADALWVNSIDRMPIRGFIDKNTELIASVSSALALIANGKSWFSPSYLKAREVRRRDPNNFTKLLTEWEQTLLGYVGNGLSDQEIGRILKIAPRTVEDHRSNIKRKLGIDHTAKLVAFALQQGLHHKSNP